MFSRIVTFTGAENIDAGVQYVRETVTPQLKQQKGFRGITASVDREAGVLGVLSLWETEADRDASESGMVKTREEGHRIIGGKLTVEMFEEALAEIAQLPTVGSSRLLIRRVSMDSDKVEANLAFFRSDVLPQIKANTGFQGVRQMINRATGEGVVGTVWADEASLKAAAKDAESRRDQAAQRGVSLGEQSEREIVFVDLQ
jgi:heme-degrading monooxygenase HmoA